MIARRTLETTRAVSGDSSGGGAGGRSELRVHGLSDGGILSSPYQIIKMGLAFFLFIVVNLMSVVGWGVG